MTQGKVVDMVLRRVISNDAPRNEVDAGRSIDRAIVWG